ncbi:hypothetical protein Tco_1559773, partial [Tanacetum coccineum]
VANKKSKTSENPSHNTPDSAHGGFNLNNETDDSMEEEVQEVRLMGLDKAKKKTSFSYVPSESSVDVPLVDLLVDKCSILNIITQGMD